MIIRDTLNLVIMKKMQKQKIFSRILCNNPILCIVAIIILSNYFSVLIQNMKTKSVIRNCNATFNQWYPSPFFYRFVFIVGDERNIKINTDIMFFYKRSLFILAAFMQNNFDFRSFVHSCYPMNNIYFLYSENCCFSLNQISQEFRSISSTNEIVQYDYMLHPFIQKKLKELLKSEIFYIVNWSLIDKPNRTYTHIGSFQHLI